MKEKKSKRLRCETGGDFNDALYAKIRYFSNANSQLILLFYDIVSRDVPKFGLAE